MRAQNENEKKLFIITKFFPRLKSNNNKKTKNVFYKFWILDATAFYNLIVCFYPVIFVLHGKIN